VHLTWEDEPLAFPRVAASCDYLLPARFEDVLDIAVSIVRLGTKSVTYGFEFTLSGKVVAQGQVTSVCCSVLPDRRLEPIEIPKGIRQRLEGPSLAT
jgi:4-hydroxybenzoyl-CoA thioesterase/acyl-CoA thioester hydrolase